MMTRRQYYERCGRTTCAHMVRSAGQRYSQDDNRQETTRVRDKKKNIESRIHYKRMKQKKKKYKNIFIYMSVCVLNLKRIIYNI